MSVMKGLIRAVVLPFFLVYALSPLYLSTMEDGAGSAAQSHADNSVTIGIYWLSCLVDTVFPAEVSVQKDGLAFMRSGSGQNGDRVLIKKKRILGRKNYACDPVFAVSVEEHAELDDPAPRASIFSIPRDLIHCHSDGYYSLSTGLSPPQQQS